MCYKKATYTTVWEGNTLWITFDYSNVKPYYRNHSISFDIASDGAGITGIVFENFDDCSSRIYDPSSSALINASYTTLYESVVYGTLNALVKVTDFESGRTQYLKDVAQAAVNLLAHGSYRIGLQVRIDAVTVIPDSKTVMVDFNGSGTSTPYYTLAAPWNTMVMAKIASGSTLSNLLDTNSSATSLGILIVDAFSDTGTNGVSGDGLPFPSGMPFGAVRDYYQVTYPATSSLKLTGCDNAKKYDFRIFSGRAFSGNLCFITVGGVQKSINVKNNTQNTLSWTDVVPVSGEILITVSGEASGWNGFLNCMEIIEHS